MENLPLASGDNMIDDPRIKEAKRLILETLKDNQREINSVKPSKTDYKDLIESFNEIRGGSLYFPYLGEGIGKGPLVRLLDGSVKYDMISGIGPHFWGHSKSELILAAIDGAIEDIIIQGHLQQNEEALTLSRLLCKASGLDHCFLTTSGAMACENALKICFQHRFPASRVLAFEHCFMGRTLALSQVTDKPAYRDGLPPTLSVDYLPFYDSERPEESTKAAINKLKEHIHRYPKQHAVLCAELVQGEAGFYCGSSSFFKAISAVLKEEGILFFADEIQTFGRTEKLFAFQNYDIQDEVDIVSIGKLSLTCATLYRSFLKPRLGLLSQTFTSSSPILKASVWAVQDLISGGYYGKNGKLALLYNRFDSHFKSLKKRFPNLIEGPFGIGGMVAFTPFGGDAERVQKFVKKLFQAGVIAFTAGSNPTRVRFLIPGGCMTNEDVDAVMNIVEAVLKEDF